MATGSVIDSKIVINGNTVQNVVIAGTKVFRVVADGNISYDRKEYTLSAATGYWYSAPVTGGTVTLPATAITSTYDGYNTSGTRVNGASVGYAISPASIPSNAHNIYAVDGYLTVMQDNSGLQLTNIRYVQSADSCEDVNIPTGLTVTLTNVAVIPASGGTVNSATVSVTANGYVRHDWISGDSTTGSTTSWTVSDYTLAWTGVTASSKGETPSQQTSAGTLYCDATYEGVTGRGSATVYQQANIVEGYTPWEYELYVNTNVTGQYPAAGGDITIEYSGKEKHKPIYTSTATGSTYEYENIGCDLTSTYGSILNPSVTGSGTTTLTLGPNTSGNRTVTITLAYEYDATKKATTSFVQTYSTYTYAYAYLSNYTGNGIITDWSDVRQVSETIQNWSSPSQDVYAVTEAGNTVYRTGTISSANAVPADTYFYENDTLTFYTRNVTTAGAEGTEHLWYKNPNFSFTVPSNIPASAATFTMSGSTANTKYYVTVTEGSTPIMNKTLYTGGAITVNCGVNSSTSSTRVFTVSFEDFYNAENADMASKTVTQAKAIAASISIDTDEWDLCNSDPLNSITVEVTSVGGGWTASYDSSYFSLSQASGAEGSTYVTVTATNRGQSGTYKYVDFVHSTLSVGRARLKVNYLNC